MRPLGPTTRPLWPRTFDDRWIDIYPNKGKESGAYSSGVYGVHPYVKMNFDGSYSDVSRWPTSWAMPCIPISRTKTQPLPTSRYPIFLAEIASTFNENMLMHELLKSETDDALKLFLLDATWSVSAPPCTPDAVRRVRAGDAPARGKGPDAHARLAEREVPRAHPAPTTATTRVLNVEDYIQYEWSGIPHFYMNYYVFQYSTGIVASMALSDKVMAGGRPSSSSISSSCRRAAASSRWTRCAMPAWTCPIPRRSGRPCASSTGW